MGSRASAAEGDEARREPGAEDLAPGLPVSSPAARRRAQAQALLASAALLVPAVERRVVAGVPLLAQARRAQVPVGADLAHHLAQVVPEVDEGRTSPVPVAVVDPVDDEPGLQHQRVRDHRVVVGVRVLLDVEVLLHGPLRVLEERPLGAERGAELLEGVVLVGRDRRDLRVGDGDFRIARDQFEVLHVLLRAVVAAGERQDHRVLALDLAQLSRRARVVGQLVVGDDVAGADTQGAPPSSVGARVRSGYSSVSPPGEGAALCSRAA